MNTANINEPPVKSEEIPIIIVDDVEPVINLTKGRNNYCNKQLQNERNNYCNKQLQNALRKVTFKMKQIEKLEQTLINRFNNLDSSNSNNINSNSNTSNPDVNINIVKPTFSTTQILHPLNFIENLMSYMDKLPDKNRSIDTVIDCLEGDARNWATIFKPRWKVFDHFVRDFIDQYWGREDQSLLKNQILNGKWFGKQETMCRHFTWLVAQARWLKNKMADEELVYEIMHHYPKNIQIAWYVSKKNTVLEATEFLKKMDEIEVLCQGRKRIRERQSMQMKYQIPSEQELPVYIPEDHGNNAENNKRFKP